MPGVRMPKPIFPPEGTVLRRFLDAMRSGTTPLHPEFMQTVGNSTMARRAEELRTLGWDVQVTDFHAPTRENPNARLALYYLRDAAFAVDAAIENWEGWQ